MFKYQILVKLTAIILCLSLVSCTAAMYSDNRDYYNETVSSVLITKDNSKLVVVGDNYHYLFDNTNVLASIVKSPIHGKMEAEFSKFIVEDDNRVMGDLKIKINRFTEQECVDALRLGFVKIPEGLVINLTLRGTRYRPGDIVLADNYQLNDEYTVLVSAPEGGAKKALKIAATPITVAADGVLVLLGVPLILLMCTLEDCR
jgi:hypothetical protein